MIHSSSIIDKKAKISKKAKIGPFCYVGPNVELSDEVIKEINKIQEMYQNPCP